MFGGRKENSKLQVQRQFYHEEHEEHEEEKIIDDGAGGQTFVDFTRPGALLDWNKAMKPDAFALHPIGFSSCPS